MHAGNGALVISTIALIVISISMNHAVKISSNIIDTTSTFKTTFTTIHWKSFTMIEMSLALFVVLYAVNVASGLPRLLLLQVLPT